MLPAFKIGIKEDEGGKGKGRGGGRGKVVYRSLTHDETQEHKHFHFRPIFSEVLVLTRFESAHSAVAGAAV